MLAARMLCWCLIFLIGSGVYTLDLIVTFPREKNTDGATSFEGPVYQGVDIPAIIRLEPHYFSTH